MVSSSLFSRTALACGTALLLLGTAVEAGKTKGRFFIQRDNGQLHGCVNEKVEWITDESQCAYFTVRDHADPSIFSLAVDGGYCRLAGLDAEVRCRSKGRGLNWQSYGSIHDSGSTLLSDGWVAGGKDNWYAKLVPGEGEAVPVSGTPQDGDAAVHIRMYWVPKGDDPHA